MTTSILRSLALALFAAVVVTAAPARSESGRLNVNADLGVGLPFTGTYGSTVTPSGSAQAYGPLLTFGADFQLIAPFAIEALGGVGTQVIPPITNAFNGLPEEYSLVPQASVALGARLRFFDDTPGSNLWTSAHAGIHYFDGLQFGIDAALGYQLASLGPICAGPFVRTALLFHPSDGRHSLIVWAGLSASFDVIPFGEDAPADTDGDGIPDERDAAPTAAEDKDGFQDEDGVPDTDNDGDRVRDELDRCPNEAGERDTAGCPRKEPVVFDRDRDGIDDDVDAAPDAAEDPDGFEDHDGAPEPDNDNDGINDVADACPLVPGIAEERGCPAQDTDADGLADRADNCPTEAGSADNQGCPAANKQLVVVTRESIKILETVYFDTGKATIQSRSFPLLDQVAGVLRDKAWIKKVSIEGHTDNDGTPEKNQVLSEQRASAVRDYLVNKGIDGGRLVAVGFGQDRPLAPNATKRGRASNRRVEFNVVEAE